MEGSHKQEELQNLLVRVNIYMYICTCIVPKVLQEQMGVKLISLLPLEHWKKKESTKGAGKLLPEVFPQFFNFIFLFY